MKQTDKKARKLTSNSKQCLQTGTKQSMTTIADMPAKGKQESNLQ